MVALLLVVFLRCASGSAQDDRARDAFEEGTAALDLGEFDRAVPLLRESLALSPRPAVAFHLALALRGAGRVREAAQLFGDLGADRFGALTDDERAEVAALERDVRAAICELQLVLHTPAEVRIDGDRSTANVVSLDPGPHIVTASLREHDPFERRIVLSPGEHATLEIELAPSAEPAALVVRADDPRTHIEVLGIGEGTGTFEGSVPPGVHVVRLERGGARSESNVEVTPGARLEIELASPRAGTIADEPAFWLVLGGVVLVGVGVGLGVALQPPPVPFEDPVFGVVATLTVAP